MVALSGAPVVGPFGPTTRAAPQGLGRRAWHWRWGRRCGSTRRELSNYPTCTPDEAVGKSRQNRNKHAIAVRQSERERIAVALTDTVIRRLFAISLHADRALERSRDPAIIERLKELVAEADDAIREVRTAIFQIHDPEDPLQP